MKFGTMVFCIQLTMGHGRVSEPTSEQAVVEQTM